MTEFLPLYPDYWPQFSVPLWYEERRGEERCVTIFAWLTDVCLAVVVETDVTWWWCGAARYRYEERLSHCSHTPDLP